ncbi:indole-3-glycerol phosphate synthase TrpC [Desulfococcaceae bacterium OttesenSCG-928-F15]|nr:indole-3-glycerol phosphate synthase TrpC [Desulfococcaceae bacterium OttesenSCG-928-F15]
MPHKTMPSILDKILEKKKARVEAVQKKIPASELEKGLSDRQQPRNFAGSLHKKADEKAAIIAEIKRSSPSKGAFARDLCAKDTAKAYEKGGAAAISVLTEMDFFSGNDGDLVEAHQASALPVLRKDFIFSPYQVLESAVLQADAILLIARILDPGLLKDLAAQAEEFGMDVLFEINDLGEIPAVLAAKPKILGINNRDLASFHTDIFLAPRLAAELPESLIPVALSGIRSAEDILATRKQGIHSFLVGEALVTSKNPASFLEELALAGKKP